MSHQLRSSKNFTDSYPVGPGNHEAKSCMDIAAHIAHPWCACGHHLHSARICLHGWITHDAGRPRRRELMEWGESLPSYVFMVIVWRAWLSTSVWFPCLVLLLRMWGITARKSWSRRETEVGKVCFKQFWAFPIAHFFIGENVEKSSNFQAGRQSCARRRFTLATVKPPVKNGDGPPKKLMNFSDSDIAGLVTEPVTERMTSPLMGFRASRLHAWVGKWHSYHHKMGRKPIWHTVDGQSG